MCCNAQVPDQSCPFCTLQSSGTATQSLLYLNGPSEEHHHLQTSSGHEDGPSGVCSPSLASHKAGVEVISKSKKEITCTLSAAVLPQVALASSLPLASSSPSGIPPKASASGLVSLGSDPPVESSKSCNFWNGLKE